MPGQSNFSRVWGSYFDNLTPVPQQKQASVAQAAAEKQARMSPLPATDDELYQAAVANTEQQAAPQLGREAQDVRSLNPSDLSRIYGPDKASLLLNQYARAGSNFARDRATSRSTGEVLGDTVKSAGQGFVGSIGGIGALGLGLANKNAGVWAAKNLGDFNRAVQASQSEGLNAQRRAYNASRANSTAENQRIQDQEGGDFGAKLRRIGRDFFEAGKRTLQDSSLTSDVVASGAGSLLTAGPLGKGLSFLGRAAMPTAIGLQEAGGTYQQTADEAYDILGSRTDITPEERVRLANRAGIEAAAVQFPVAAATGKLVSRFEASPFKVPTLGTAAGNLIRETLEEGTQSATSQLATNKAIRDQADPNRDIAQDVGEQTALGAIGGLGAAGVVQVPGAVGRSAKAGVDALVGGANRVVSAVNGRVSNVRKGVEAQSPLAPAKINPELQQAATEAPQLHQELSEAIQSSGRPDVTDEQKVQAQSGLDRMLRSSQFSDEVDVPTAPNSFVRAAITGSADKFEALGRAGRIITSDDENIGPKTRLAAGLYMLRTLRSQENELSEIIAPLADNDPLVERAESHMQRLGLTTQHPEIQKALKAAQEFENSIKPADVRAARIKTPEGQEDARTAAELASLVPERSDRGVNDLILRHAIEGTLDLAPYLIGGLKTANAVQEAGKVRSEQAERLGLNKLDVVSRAIQTDETAPENLYKSVSDHVVGIQSALSSGNDALAKRRLGHFMSFAQSMQNKLAAVNASYLSGTGTKENTTGYEAYDPNTGEFFQSEAPIFVDGTNRGSVKFGQTVDADARAVGSVANQMALAYPQLGIEPIELGALHPSLTQANAKEVSRDYYVAKKQGTLDEFLGNKKTEPDVTPAQPDNKLAGVKEIAYHGTAAIFDKFGVGKEGAVFFTDSEKIAGRYARKSAMDLETENEEGNILRREIDLSNFQEIDKEGAAWHPQLQRDEINAAKEAGYSGIVYRNYNDAMPGNVDVNTVYAVFDVDTITAPDTAPSPAQPPAVNPASVDRTTSETNRSRSAPAPAPAPEARSEPVPPRTEKAPEGPAPARQDTQAPPPSRTNEAKAEPAKRVVQTEDLDRPSQDQDQLNLETGSDTAPTSQLQSELDRKPSGNPMDAAYPDLLGSSSGAGSTNNSLFKRAFRLPKSEQGKSRLTAREDVLGSVRDAIRSVDSLRSFIGSEDRSSYAQRLKPGVARAYDRFLSTLVPMVSEQMEKQLQSQMAKPVNGSTFGEQLQKEGSNYPAFKNLRATNIVDVRDGKLSYNEGLLQSAILAGMQWFLNLDQRGVKLDQEDVAKILGINEAQVTDDQVREFNQGAYFADAATDLASMITRFWGLDADRSAPEGLTRGIPEAVAKEMIRAMARMKDPVLKIIPIQFGNKTYYQVQTLLKPDEKRGIEGNQQYVELLGNPKQNKDGILNMPTLLENLALVEPEEEIYVNRVPPKRPEFQLRNRNVPLTREQARMRSNEEAVPHYVNGLGNQGMADLVLSLGSNGMIDLFGHGDLEEQQLNAEHKTSLEGVNTGVASAYQTFGRVLQQVRSVAEAESLDPTEVPVHYTYDFTSVGRLQMNGRQNPQANKLVRELVMPTRSTLDLSDPDSKETGLFMLGLAQAWGIKVHKLPRAESIRKTQELIDGPYAPLIKATQEWLNQGEKGRTDTGQANLIKLMRGTLAGGGPVPVVAVHAITEYARLQQAQDKSRFTTSIYVEADGVTDGPINAMVHMASGRFTPSWLKTVRKGGLFVGQQDMTLNTFSQEPEGREDLYTQTSRYLTQYLNEFATKVSGDKQLSGRFSALKNLMRDLNFNLQIKDDGTIEIDRGAVKNPLTVKIYGAGESGIAGKIASLLQKAVYERESQILQAQARGDQDAVNKLVAYRDQLSSVVNDRKLKAWGQDFKLSEEQSKAMLESVLQLYVKPALSPAIDQSIGETQRSVTMIQRSTNAMSIVFRDAFLRDLQEKMDAKAKADPNWRRDTLLSQEEIQEVFDANKNLAPYVSTGTQDLLVGGSDRTDLSTSNTDKSRAAEFSRTLNDDLATPAYTFAPGEAGVSGIPFTVIATGDGQMMQTFSVDFGGVGGKHLLIFDGANFSLDQLEQGSRDVNEAVHKGWMRNPFGSVTEAYSKFLDQKFELSQELSNKLARNFGLKGGTVDDVRQKMSDLLAEMRTTSNEIQARKAVLGRVNTSVDHMASAEAPFYAQGSEDVSALGDEQLIDRLNKMFEEELSKITGEKIETKTETAEPEKLGSVEGSDLIRMLGPKASPMMRRVAQVAAQKGYKVVTGPIQKLNEMASSELGRDVSLPDSDVKGFVSPGTKTIYLAGNPSQETLVHEMLHAATTDLIHDYYTNSGQNLTPSQQSSIRQIERLMNEWLALEDQGNVDAVSAVRNAKSPTEKLGEFVSWGLTNRDVIAKSKETSTKNSLMKILRSLLDQVVKLAESLGIDLPGSDIYSNLRFNTAVLIAEDNSVQSELADIVQYQSQSFGSDNRLTALRERISEILASSIVDPRLSEAERARRNQDTQSAGSIATQVARSFETAGFLSDQQQISTFQQVVAMLGSDALVDSNLMTRAQELYAHVTKTMTVEDLMEDPEADLPADRFMAQEKYNALLGINTLERDPKGRSTLLPAFVALSMVDPGFQSVIAQMELPKTEKDTSGTIDAKLANIGNAGMDYLGRASAGEYLNEVSVGSALVRISDRIIESAREDKSWVSQLSNQAGSMTDRANTWVTDQMTRLSELVDEKLKNADPRNKATEFLVDAGRVGLGLVNNEIASANAEGIIQLTNQFKRGAWAELIADMVGRTKSNGQVYDLIKKVRSAVSAARQRYIEELPKLIDRQFGRKITDAEHTAMYRAWAKTDVASLFSGFSESQVLELLVDPVKRTSETRAIERRIGNPLVTNEAQKLARYMVSGKADRGLLRNAHAIAEIVGGKTGKELSSYVQDVDHLVTLYALEESNQEDMESVSSLVQDKDTLAGSKFVLSYLRGQRTAELADLMSHSDAVRLNHYKGYVPSVQLGKNLGKSLIVADDQEFTRLRELGYERISDYEGAAGEAGSVKRGYYYVPVSGRAGFSQGIIQTVHMTVAGVDQSSGYSTSTLTAGRIDDPDLVRETERRLKRLGTAGGDGSEHLIPVYTRDRKTGSIYVKAYERAVDPRQVERLGRSTDLSKMLGSWRGRQKEEALATAINDELIGKLGDMWRTKGVTEADQFINILDPRELKADPVLADAVKLIPWHTLLQAGKEFGSTKEFWVRKDMLNNAIGYRKASVGDFWTGNTRFSKQTQDAVRSLATAAFGFKAYQTFVKGEKILENVVTDAKTTIVVRSLFVPIGNIVSNMYQLAASGVPLDQALRMMPKKTAEVEAYVKGLRRTIEIEGLRRAAEGGNDTKLLTRLQSEETSIKDSWRRMTIWPMIKAGELNSISDTGVGKEEIQLAEGKLGEYIEGLVQKLPDSLKNMGRYFWITTDTPLFKGLQKAVDYGDFLAKSIAYDDLVKRKGMKPKEALAKITEKFVNYNYLAGRTMDKLDSVGALWFWRFKVRSVKEALALIRENPVHALLASLVPAPPLVGTIGSPLTDNLLSLGASGRLEYSIGPGMGLRAQTMNPWINMLGI